MSKLAAVTLALLLTTTLSCHGQPAAPQAAVRPAALAGSWYPAEPEKLRALVKECVAAAAPAGLKGVPVALVCPHAGYVYSARVAGWSYRQVAEGEFHRVIILAPSHRGAFRGFSIMNASAYRTPLGDVPLDREACEKLQAHPLFVEADALHRSEHAIEIQLPFLQTALKEFRIVPALVGSLHAGDAEKIADALREQMTPTTLVVVSSDFTHYGPNYDYLPFKTDVEENLRKLDMGAVDRILKRDAAGFAEYLGRTGATICGREPLAILLRLLPDSAEGRLLQYDTSGRMTGDFTNSVSYVSAVFTRIAPPPAVPQPKSDSLSPEERQTLLRLARDAMERFVRTGKELEVDEKQYALTPRLRVRCGAFVTLKKKGELRGCIGNIAQPETVEQVQPLYRTVASMAVEAAARDPRFEPVTTAELREIVIEVSVLSVATPVSGPEAFEVGKHGIIIRRGMRGAVFLPQVAPEQGWDREQTLGHLCRKAGLPAQDWKQPGMKFLTFTAEVFSEK